MTVHLFGATSSAGCTNYGLKAIAEDNKQEFGEEFANFVKRNFYVGDGWKSLIKICARSCISDLEDKGYAFSGYTSSCPVQETS